MNVQSIQKKHTVVAIFGGALLLAVGLVTDHVSKGQSDGSGGASNTTRPAGETQVSERNSETTKAPTRTKENAGVVKQRRILRQQCICVGTDRLQVKTDDDSIRFGTSSGPLRYVRCEVSVGNGYKRGQLEDISVESIALVKDIRKLPQPVKPNVNGDGPRALVFIHGFFVGFEESIRRAMQIVHELDYRGAVFVYTWPSVFQMSPDGYRADKAVVARSVKSFARFLQDLTTQYGGGSLQILAHSLGCRLVSKAVQTLDAGDRAKKKAKPRKIDNIIFAAPDIEVANFSRRYVEPLTEISRRLTIYHSSRDQLLKFAEKVDKRGPRLGRTGASRADLRVSVEFVDYSRLPGGHFNLRTHNLYREHPAIVKDIRGVLVDTIPRSIRDLLFRSQSPQFE